MRRTVYFATHDYQEIARIRQEYGLHGNLTVNGEIECELDESMLVRLKVEAEKGLIQIRKK